MGIVLSILYNVYTSFDSISFYYNWIISIFILIFIFALLNLMLLDTYGWRGSLLLLSGLLLHSVPFSAVISFQTSEKQGYNTIFDSIESVPDAELEEDTCTTSILNKASKKIGFSLVSRMCFVTRVLVPSLVVGYTLIGWMIYMVSFAIYKSASLKEAAIVVTSGGIGMLLARIIGIPILHKFMTLTNNFSIHHQHQWHFLCR